MAADKNYLNEIFSSAILGQVPKLGELRRNDDLGQHVGQLGLRLAVDGSRTIDRHDLQDWGRLGGEKEDFSESTFADLRITG